MAEKEVVNKLENQLSQREKEDRVRRMMSIAQGIDPDAQQAINDFIIFKNPIERTNLPTRKDVHFVAYLDLCAKVFYPEEPNNPFTKLAYAAVTSFMAKGGQKSEQFVQLMKQTPNLIDLQTTSQLDTPQQGGILNRLFNRGQKNE